MLATAYSGTPIGVEAALIRVEVSLLNNLEGMEIVGLPENAVKEGKVRVRSALNHIGYPLPAKKVIVNLGPADLRKEGSAFDLPIALALMGALNPDLSRDLLDNYLVVGELTLDGQVRPVRGVLPCAVTASKSNLKGVLVPQACGAEAVAVSGLATYTVSSLEDAIKLLRGEMSMEEARFVPDRTTGTEGKEISQSASCSNDIDLRDVRGQAHARRALEVAAAGGHNLIFIGPPGSGKSMLARRLTTIMPELSEEEAVEVTSIYSVKGLLSPGQGLIRHRPFRAPHHTISQPALIGGGQGMARPGELSLSHLGVLFLDELPEFRPMVTECLRQPLEDGSVCVGRARGSIRFPAKVALVAAMNPCPCGHQGSPRGMCRCTPFQVHSYRSKVSGPLLDRIDLHIEVPEVPWKDLSSASHGESSARVRERVIKARQIQRERFAQNKVDCNAHMSSAQLRQACQIDQAGKNLLEKAMTSFGFSARAHDRLLKVARTIADLEGENTIKSEHVAEAIQYRSLDRRNQAMA